MRLLTHPEASLLRLELSAAAVVDPRVKGITESAIFNGMDRARGKKHYSYVMPHHLMEASKGLFGSIFPEEELVGTVDRTQLWIHQCAIYRWTRGGKPLFQMTEELATTLMHTKTAEPFVPVIPHDGMYVQVPPVCNIANDMGDCLPIEGFYLYSIEDCYGTGFVYCISSQDRAKGAWVTDLRNKYIRDDAFLFGSARNGKLPDFGEDRAGNRKAINLLWNFLWFWKKFRTAFKSKNVLGPPLKGRREARQIKRLAKKNKGWLNYKLLGLNSKITRRATSRASSGKVKAHWVSGYLNYYWVNQTTAEDNKDDVFNVREDGRVKVARLILPHVRGEGEAPQKKAVLRK